MRDRLAALLAGEQVGDDREGGGHDQRRAHAHRRAHGDHLVGRVGDEGAEAGEPEDRHAGLERELAPEAVAERAEHEQQAGEDEQVGVDHPLQLRGGSVELVLQRRQGDVEDRVVEPDDHQAQRQHAERLPTAGVLDGIDRHQAALLSGYEGRAHRTAEAEASAGRVRERVVEGVERVCARDVEVELLVEPLVGDGDPDSVGRLAPEERDCEAVGSPARELFPVVDGGGGHD